MDKLLNNSTRNVIQVAVGIVTNAEGQLLVAKRPDHWMGGGFWEFPGGKLEPNEDSQGALKRELLEEVGIVVQQCSPLIRLTYDYPERRVILHAWNVQAFTGKATGLEGQEICWRDPKSLNQLNMLPANRAIVVATQLPDIYLVTPDFEDRAEFLYELEKKIQDNGIKLVQLRSPNLDKKSYIDLAKKASTLCRKNQAYLLLNHSDLEVLEVVEADGVQLQAAQLKNMTERPLSKSKWVGVDCYTQEDISKAEEINADFVVINSLPSGSNSQGLSWQDFDKLVSVSNIPVFAEGNLDRKDLVIARQHGAQGIVIS